MENGSVVVIPLDRYTELIQLETRVDSLVERIYHDNEMSVESLLWALGTDLSVELANEIWKRREGCKADDSENQNDYIRKLQGV